MGRYGPEGEVGSDVPGLGGRPVLIGETAKLGIGGRERETQVRPGRVMSGGDVPGERLSDPGDLLPLTSAALNVLLALADGERHGYGIMLEVRERTGGRVRLGPGTLYGTIKRMLGDELIEEAGDKTDPSLDDQRRRYYRLTDLGLRVAQAEAARLERLVSDARIKHLLPKGT